MIEINWVAVSAVVLLGMFLTGVLSYVIATWRRAGEAPEQGTKDTAAGHELVSRSY